MEAEKTDSEALRNGAPALRRWNGVGWCITAYMALSSLALWAAILRGELSGLLDDPMEPLSPFLIVCPLGAPICFSQFFGRAAGILIGCLPLLGWCLLRRGFRSGRTLLIFILGLTLTVSPLSLLFCMIDVTENGHWPALFMLVTQILLPILVLNAITVVAPAIPDPPAEASASDAPSKTEDVSPELPG